MMNTVPPVETPTYSLRTRARKRAFAFLFLFSLIAYFLTCSGRFYSLDGMTIFELSVALVERGTIDLDPGPGVRYSQYGPLQSVLGAAFYAAAKPVREIIESRFPSEFAASFPMGFFNVIVTALSVLAMAIAAFELGLSLRGAVITALIWGFATIAWPYSKYDFSEPLQTLLLLCSLGCIARSIKRDGSLQPALAGVFMGLAVLTKYVNAVPAAIFGAALVLMMPRPKIRVAAYALPVAAALALVLLHNFVRFGDPLETGYHLDALDKKYAPLGGPHEVLLGVLFSGGKSLFLFSPPLVLAILNARKMLKNRPLYAGCIVAVFLALVLVYSRFSFWGGGLAWGPRYFIPVTALGILAASPLVDIAVHGRSRRLRAALVAIVVAGVAVQALAISVRFNTAYENGEVERCFHLKLDGRLDEEKQRPGNLCKSPLVKEAEVLFERTPKMLALTRDALAGDPNLSVRRGRHDNTYLDFWQAYLIPEVSPALAWLTLAGSALAAAAAFAALAAALRAAREFDNSAPPDRI